VLRVSRAAIEIETIFGTNLAFKNSDDLAAAKRRRLHALVGRHPVRLGRVTAPLSPPHRLRRILLAARLVARLLRQRGLIQPAVFDNQGAKASPLTILIAQDLFL
jgi:hypothetical protein